MASGYFDVYVRSQKTEYYRVSWSDKPVANTNKSEVTVSVKYYSKWRTYSSYKKDLILWIDGTKYTGRGDIDVKGWSKTFMTKKKTISHNSDGKKSIKIRFWGEVGIKYTGKWYDDVDSGNHTVKLTTIDALPSTLTTSSSTITLGNNHSYKITRKSSKARHTVTLKIGSYSKSLLSKSSKYGSISFEVPTAALSYMSGQTATATLTLTTYIGTRNVGSSSDKFTVKIPSSAKPTIGSVTVSPVPNSEGLVTNEYVQGKSRAKITLSNVSVPNGASGIKKYTYNIDGVNYDSTSSTLTLDTLQKTGTSTVTVTALDSRGMVSSPATTTFVTQPYNKPVISSASATRYDGNSPSQSGTRVKISASWSYSVAGKVNNKTTIKIYIKRSTEDNYSLIKTISNVTSFNDFIDGEYSANYSYDIKIEITDNLGGSATYITDIDTEDCLVDISPYGVSIGKVFEGTKKEFQCGYVARFEDKAFINGNTAVTSDKRFKDHIEPLQPVIKDIWQLLNIYSFNYKNGSEELNLGVMAQDIIKLFDGNGLNWKDYNLVVEYDDRYYVNYEFLNMVTMAIVQEQENRIKTLEDKIELLTS